MVLAGGWAASQDRRIALAYVPTARVETIPGAGHLANLDQPEAFADAVLRFTREVTDSAHGG